MDKPFPVLETDRLVLRPIGPEDTDALLAIHTEPMVRRFLTDDEVFSRDQVVAYIEQSISDFDAYGAGYFGIQLRDAQQPVVGLVGFRRDQTSDFEFLFFLSHERWGHGYMSEATRAVLDYGFSKAGIDRVVFNMDQANVDARKLAQLFDARLTSLEDDFVAYRPLERSSAQFPGHRLSDEHPHPTAVYSLDRSGFEEAVRRWDPDTGDELDDRLKLTTPELGNQQGVLDPFRGGDVVGRYQIEGFLGRGPIMAYYRAVDPLLEREVALCSYVAGNVSEVAANRKLLEREARFIAGLSHPAIVPVLDGGMHEGAPYYVYEAMPRTLADQLLETDSLPWERCVEIGRRLASALDFIHRRGYVHRDVKPSNVFLNSFGEAHLGGLAIANQSDHLPIFQGLSPQYAPPEVVRDGIRDEVLATLRVSPTYDIWSLGVVLYESLAGSRPYRLRDLLAAYGGTLRSPTPVSSLVPEVPTKLDKVLERCLEQHAKDRYQTCAEIVTALDGLAVRRSDSATRVFISHSSSDREFVESHIVTPLEQGGIKTWYSRVAIQTAAEWERSILEGLSSSDWFLLVASPRSLDSEWVKDELFWAIDNRADRIIPVVIGQCSPADFHIRLRRIQPIDFVDDPVEGRSKLLAVLRDESDTD